MYAVVCLQQASARKTVPAEVPDIDAADRNNPLACTTYVNDIYAYWRRVEVSIAPQKLLVLTGC